MMQLDLFGTVEAESGLRPGPAAALNNGQLDLFGEPAATPAPAAAAAEPAWRFNLHERGEVMLATNLPEGWRLVADGFNGFTIVPPEDWTDHPEGGYGRFWYSDSASLEAAVREAEVIVRRIINTCDWTPMIQIGPNHYAIRADYEKMLEAWRASGWKRLPAGSHYRIQNLMEPGVMQQFPEHLQPPQGAWDKATRAIRREQELELERERQAEENGELEDAEDE
jgi:hypothetical protein